MSENPLTRYTLEDLMEGLGRGIGRFWMFLLIFVALGIVASFFLIVITESFTKAFASFMAGDQASTAIKERFTSIYDAIQTGYQLIFGIPASLTIGIINGLFGKGTISKEDLKIGGSSSSGSATVPAWGSPHTLSVLELEVSVEGM